MLVMRTIEDPAYPIGELVSSKQSVGFDYFALAVNPLGLYGVQPRTLLWQKATHDPHTFTTLLDPAVVFFEASSDLFGDVPARVVPDQKQERTEKHTSELQSRQYHVCRLLLAKKKYRGHRVLHL